MVNIYAPNTDSPSFSKHVFAQIPDILHTNILVGGDLILVLDPYLDRSSSRRAPPSNSSIFLKEYCNNSNRFELLIHRTEHTHFILMFIMYIHE